METEKIEQAKSSVKKLGACAYRAQMTGEEHMNAIESASFLISFIEDFVVLKKENDHLKKIIQFNELESKPKNAS